MRLTLFPVCCFQCYTKQQPPALPFERSKSPAHVPELICNSTAQWDAAPAFPELHNIAFQVYGFPNQAMPAAFRALSFKQEITLPLWKVTKSEHLWTTSGFGLYSCLQRNNSRQNSSYLLWLKQQKQVFTAKKTEMFSRTWTVAAEMSSAHLFYKKLLAHRYTSIQPLLVFLQHLLLFVYLPSQITVGLKMNREQSLWLQTTQKSQTMHHIGWSFSSEPRGSD